MPWVPQCTDWTPAKCLMNVGIIGQIIFAAINRKHPKSIPGMNISLGIKRMVGLLIKFNKGRFGEFLAGFAKSRGGDFNNGCIAFVLHLKKAVEFALNGTFGLIETKANKSGKGKLCLAGEGFISYSVFLNKLF